MMFMQANFSLGLDDVDGSEEPRRFASLPCKTLLAYGGDDGTVTCLDEKDNTFHAVQRFDDCVRAVAVSEDGKRVAVGFDSGEIEIFHYDTFELEKASRHPFAEINEKANDDDLLSQGFSDCHKASVGGPQFDAPIRDLQFLRGTSPTFWLIVAHESGMSIVDVTTIDSMSSRVLERESRDAHGQCGIRGVCQRPDSSQIVSLSMDGKLCLWNTDLVDHKMPSFKLAQFETNRCIAKQDAGEIHGADACERSYRPVLHGDVLATPGRLTPLVHYLGKESRIMEVKDCDTNRHIEPVVSLVFLSSDFMISSGRDCRMVLWKCDFDKFALSSVASITSTSVVTAFHAREMGSIYAACTKGTCIQLNVEQRSVESKLPKDSDSPRNHISETLACSNELKKKSSSEHGFCVHEGAHSEYVDDEASVDSPSRNGTKSDTPTGFSQGEQKKGSNEELGSEDESEAEEINAPNNLLSQLVREETPQPPFSVSSTPLDLARRYLCWNHIGSVTILNGTEGASHRSTVDISFTDSAYKRPVSFTDNTGFIVGSLGEDGAIFASDLQKDDDDGLDERNLRGLQISEQTLQAVKRSQRKRIEQNAKPTGSSIFFYRFETLGALRDKDWFLNLPTGERVVGSACGSGWAAVVTSRRFLRLFSSGGNQGQILWLNGDPVTVAGRSRFLIVFCHRSLPLVDKTQQLDYVLWDIASFTVISQGPASCVGKGAALSWAGFSSDCAPMAMDSDGIMSMLTPCSNDGRNWQWIPVLDTLGLRKSSEDNFWPITVQDGRLVCVPLKGSSTYPDAARRPITATLGLRMPFATSSPAKFTMLEELSIRSNLALSQKRALEIDEDDEEYVGLCAQVDKVTLKLFVGMMDEGKVERALDLIDRLHLPKSYEIAARMAEHNRKVADLIEDAKHKNFPQEEDDTMGRLVCNSGSPEPSNEDPHFVTPVSNQPLQKRNKAYGDRTFKKPRIY
ncbi:unnamed protein product [Cylindrotheca closterium]|uniref:WDHD1/CFT4 second beta-propeller domain-containing protein n=1 Tax=Cylindrotheca closterium TaxID=2856 RepID=A0AAD2PTY7_9STRA|nr:unnamed protein product [Cylindrotheca closterium]